MYELSDKVTTKALYPTKTKLFFAEQSSQASIDAAAAAAAGRNSQMKSVGTLSRADAEHEKGEKNKEEEEVEEEAFTAEEVLASLAAEEAAATDPICCVNEIELLHLCHGSTRHPEQQAAAGSLHAPRRDAPAALDLCLGREGDHAHTTAAGADCVVRSASHWPD